VNINGIIQTTFRGISTFFKQTPEERILGVVLIFQIATPIE
jgi:hypothetical protein